MGEPRTLAQTALTTALACEEDQTQSKEYTKDQVLAKTSYFVVGAWNRYAPLVRFTPHALDLLHEGYSNGRVGYVEVDFVRELACLLQLVF